jgi:hypothetical protein
MFMIRILLAAAAFSALSISSFAAEQPKAAAVAAAEADAVIELVSVDKASRMAVFKGPAGNLLYINVPPEAQNLDRVKPGDLFRVRYLEALALALHKGGKASGSEAQVVKLAPKGGTPGGAVVNTKQMTTVITAVDRPSRTITVRGPQKNPVTLKVADEVRAFDELAVGDTIAVTYTEALALQMIPGARAK